MKKISRLILTFCTLALLSGCTKEDTTGNTVSKTAETSAENRTSAGKETTLTTEADVTTSASRHERHERQNNDTVTGASQDEDALTGASAMTVGKVEAIKIIKQSALSGYDIGQMIQVIKASRTTEAMLDNFNQVNDAFNSASDSDSIAKMKQLAEQINN